MARRGERQIMLYIYDVIVKDSTKPFTMKFQVMGRHERDARDAVKSSIHFTDTCKIISKEVVTGHEIPYLIESEK